MAFHQSVYDGYVEIAKMYPKRIKTINGLASVDDIVNEIYLDIKGRL